ncbi:MAG: TIM-barrel domain-containing protein [bacterium]
MTKNAIHYFLIVLALTKTAVSQTGIGEVTAIELTDNKLSLHAGSEVVVFQVCLPNVIKANYLPQGVEDPDTLVIGNTDWSVILASFDTTGNPIVIQTNKLTVEISRSPLRFRVLGADSRELVRERTDEGFFSRGIKLNVAGSNFYGIHNAQFGSLTRNNGGRIEAGRQGQGGAPFLWTTDGYGLLMDTHGGQVTINNGMMDFLRDDGGKRDIELYVIAGTPREIFSGMVAVSGRAPLFPKFAYGFLNTEWGMDQDELLEDVRTYREKKIPIDAYVLDFDWMDWGSDNYGEFRWGPKFPDGPSGALKMTLDSLGLKLFGIRKPRVHVNTQQGQEVQSNGLFFDMVTDYFSNKQVWRLDFHKPETRKWYWETFINQGDAFNKGIIGYWNDEADEYGGNMMFMQMQRANYEGQRSYNNQRIWSINRNFYLGAQRYAYCHWSGDIATGFASMASQRLFMLSSINLGSTWWGMDIGGFNGTPRPENYIRWMQFGAFVPVYRVHGVFNEEREPWNYGPDAERITRRYIEMRYRLLPYIYSGAWENHQTGVPIVRPLIFDYPDDIRVTNLTSEWLFGDELLVRPVVSANARTASIYLPEGKWIDFHGEDFYTGPNTITVPVTLEDIPIFVKAGAVIPMAPAAQFVGVPALPQDVLHLECYPEGASEFVLYEDDGITYDYENGNHSTTWLSFSDDGTSLSLTIEGRMGPFVPIERDYQAAFHLLEEKPTQVRVNFSLIRETTVDSLSNGLRDVWAYDAQSKSCLVRIRDDGTPSTILVTRGLDTVPPAVDSVFCASPDSVIVRFTERVLLDNRENSATNKVNYRISNGVMVLAVNAFPDEKSVALRTTPHVVNQSYSIEVSNIADQSSQKNVMAPVTKTYACEATQTIVLQHGLAGYEGASDAHIAEYFPNHNMGGNPLFEAGRFDGANNLDDKSMLVRFDLSSTDLNDPADIAQADLVLALADTRNGEADKQLAAYRLLRDWNEGTANVGIDGRQAQTGEVTWNSASHPTVTWRAPGGDFVQSFAEAVTVGANPGAEYSWDITQIVKHWIARPDSNFGIILREPAPSHQNGTKVFYASEYEEMSLRPKLKIRLLLATPVEDSTYAIPDEFVLYQNYPNPIQVNNAHRYTMIRYDLPARSRVSLKVYNVRGQVVATLVDGWQEGGRYEIPFKLASLPSGFYFYRLKAGDFAQSRKVLILR